ncbi:YbfB/YjiJ family MFS transporter [Streptomyces sp. NBC_01497]|uniref:YbfB/YjiJ family MFS transporter n=1 Tax=Streptomyces sp. NBC_01497 TaxID=2903885 RepID=UPI002E348D21|nr:YbfB/YjiJ family MFS transporter [Streptomyces sp. NBC_01497]
MGVGRFVYTPILPLMHAQAGLSASAGADLATSNYVGYLAGALVGTLAPRLVRSAALLRASLVVLVATLAAMPLTQSTTMWLALRLLAGLTSALIFVIAVNSLLGHLREHPAHLPGWAFGGVGAGIALSGILVLLLRSAGDWRDAWWASAALTALFAVASWNLRTESPPPPQAPLPAQDQAQAQAGNGATRAQGGARANVPRTRRWFIALFVSYTLEGVGYIIAGTFLVAAIGQGSPGWIGSGAWVLVGLAAVPASALWTWLGRTFSRPTLLAASLTVQGIGIALPALVGGVAAALVSAFLFGATFLGVATLALATGTHLRFPRAVALLTAGYSVGQILGPLTAAPLLHHGYHQALLLAAAVTAAAALAAGVLRIRFPHHMPQATAFADGASGGPDTSRTAGVSSPGR